MKLTLYRMFGEDNRINKASCREVLYSLTGTLRRETSITSPVIEVHLSGTIDLKIINYAYIEEFNRFYFIDDIISVRNEVWEFHFRVDVLQSYYSVINDLPCIVARTSNEEYVSKDLVDDRIPMKPTFTRTIEYEYPLSPVITNNSASRNNSILVTIGQVDVDLNDGSVGTDYDNSYFNIPSWQLTGNSNSMCHYIFARAELATFLEKIYANSELFSYIISIKCFPVDLTNFMSTKRQDIVLDGKTVYYGAKLVTGGSQGSDGNVVAYLLTHSNQIKINKIYNDFRDYSPITNYSIIFPFYGEYKIPNQYLYSGVYFDIVLDFLHSQIMYSLYTYEDNKLKLISTLTADLSVELAFTSTNAQEIKRSTDVKIIQGSSTITTSLISLISGISLIATGVGTGLGTGLAIGGASGIVGGTLNTAAQLRSIPNATATYMQGRNNVGVFSPTKIVIIRESFDLSDTPSNISSVLGLPSMKWIEHISDLGSNVILYVYDCHLDGITALKTEKDEIYRLLRSGVIT